MECRKYNLFPNYIINNTKNANNISFHNRSVCKQLNSVIEKLTCHIQNMEINDIHNHLHFSRNKSNIIKKFLTSLIPTYLSENLISYQNNLNSEINNTKIKLDKKMKNLKSKQVQPVETMFLNKHKNDENSDPCLINYSTLTYQNQFPTSPD